MSAAAIEQVAETTGVVHTMDKAMFFEWLGYEIHTEDVLAFHKSTARLVVVSAPARTSKSYAAAHEMAYDAFPPWTECPHTGKKFYLESRLLWCVGPDYNTNKEFDYLFDILVNNREKYGFDFKLKRKAKSRRNGDLQIWIEWGKDPYGNLVSTEIVGKSVMMETSLQGEEVYSAVMSEAAEHPPHILRKYLSTRCGRIYMPTTPKPKADWIRELIDRGKQDPDTDIDSFHFAIDYEKKICPNPKYDWKRFASEKKIAEARTDTGKAEDDPLFAEQFLGHWVYYAGRVLPFRHQKGTPGRYSHVISQLPQDFHFLRKFVSVDYGYDHNAVALFWAVLPDGTLIIFDELVGKGMNATVFVETIQQRVRLNGLEIDYYVGDPSRPEIASQMRSAGLNVWDRGSKNALRDRPGGYTRLTEMLADDEVLARPKLFVHERCIKTIHEFKGLHRKEGFVGDEYSKAALNLNYCSDDCFDAARYGVQSRPNPKLEVQQDNWWSAYEKKRGGNYWRRARQEVASFTGRFGAAA